MLNLYLQVLFQCDIKKVLDLHIKVHQLIIYLKCQVAMRSRSNDVRTDGSTFQGYKLCSLSRHECNPKNEEFVPGFSMKLNSKGTNGDAEIETGNSSSRSERQLQTTVSTLARSSLNSICKTAKESLPSRRQMPFPVFSF